MSCSLPPLSFVQIHSLICFTSCLPTSLPFTSNSWDSLQASLFNSFPYPLSLFSLSEIASLMASFLLALLLEQYPEAYGGCCVGRRGRHGIVVQKICTSPPPPFAPKWSKLRHKGVRQVAQWCTMATLRAK